jgi:CubicO group peptidase (beta-lactamase class C family)
VERPETHGIDPAALERAVDATFAEPDPLRPVRTLAVVVVHGGAIVAERYATGVGPDTPLPGWSMAKALTTALAGILVGDGALAPGAAPPGTGWKGPDRRAAITLDHLLRMTSGLSWSEDYLNPLRSDVLSMLFGEGRQDMAAYVAARPLAAAPGTRWSYNSGSTVLAAAALRAALGDFHTYHAFPRRRLFDRIGMRSAVLEADETGTFVGSSYWYASARDFARFGLLLLRDGTWGAERILPAGWVAYMRTPTAESPGGCFGAGLWLGAVTPRDPMTAASPMRGVPYDAFYAWGKDGQFLVVVPSRDLVIVRLGVTPLDDRWSIESLVRDAVAATPAAR